jgi:hypothetical protein
VREAVEITGETPLKPTAEDTLWELTRGTMTRTETAIQFGSLENQTGKSTISQKRDFDAIPDPPGCFSEDYQSVVYLFFQRGCSAGTLDFIEFGVTPHLRSK